jgi:hypothetical protein
MRGIHGLVICAVAGWIGFAADAADAALAKRLGGSGLSGQLSSNKAIRKQQLIADPDEPTGGSESLNYDASIVTLSNLSFGPGYTGQGFVEVLPLGALKPVMQDLSSFLVAPVGKETGYAQVTFTELAGGSHGQIKPPAGYGTVNKGGPNGVDTHAFLFNYLSTAADTDVAVYTLYADNGLRPGGNHADFLTGADASGSFQVGPGEIAPITVRGSLVAVPIPPAVWGGGLTLLGVAVSLKLRRKLAAA